MARSFAKLSASLLLFSGLLCAQGLNTTATKDDWEEINFEFNSAILSDGYPSLLRLAELLNKNPDYKVRLIGNTDWVGSHPYNDKLGRRRAEAVRQFLEKYGARPTQIAIDTKGENSPKVDNKTREGRFMNRRVEMVVTDGTGKIVGAGGVGDILKTLQEMARKQEECCSQILRRLDKLDEILAALRDLKTANDALQARVNQLENKPAPPAAAPAPVGPPPASREDIRNEVQSAVNGLRQSRFSVLGLNAGPDSNGHATFTGKGRFFAPFNKNTAFQAQGEYMYFNDRKEGQFDVGLVNRWWNVQLGGFGSFKTVGIRDMQNNATLGQFAGVFDYLFKHGKVGIFGTKGFINESVVKSIQVGPSTVEQTYLRVSDQLGGQAAVNLGKKAWVEGNLGFVRARDAGNKPGGTIRFVFPVNRLFALTAEGGFNETLITKDNNGRAVFGLMFGNFLTPREYVAADHPVPVEVPRVRYEMLTRRIRNGNAPPVADAGPDQNGVAAGTIQLDGSGSFDPDGDPITYQWTQIAGSPVTLSAPTAAKTTFTAAEGQIYAFRLTVKDSYGAQGTARVSITTKEATRVRIIRFTSNPPLIRPGENATLNYVVENADSVTINGQTQSNPNTGAMQVSPATTTNYTLVATKGGTSETAVASVLVDKPLPRIIQFTANPPTVEKGAETTLTWQTQDAVSVDITGIATNLPPNGTRKVKIDDPISFALIARNPYGEAGASTVVNLLGGGGIVPPGTCAVVNSFTASPVTVTEGDPVTLAWNVSGVEKVVIQPFGELPAVGSRTVTPTATTTYTLTATNTNASCPNKTATATATVEIIGKAKIATCTVQPTSITDGQPITFTWATENAQYVFIDRGVGQRAANGSLTTAGPVANPPTPNQYPRTVTYNLTAVGKGSQAACSLSVTVTGPPPGGGSLTDTPRPGNENQTPTAVISNPDIRTSLTTVTLNGSGSYDPKNSPLTYSWRSIDGGATIASPTSASTTVQLTDIANRTEFRFELTVSNKAGLISKQTARVTYVPNQPLVPSTPNPPSTQP